MLKRNQDKHTNGTIAQNLPFPVDVFPPKTRRFIQETATSIGVENSLPASILLSVVSGLIGRSAQIKLKGGYREIASIWMVQVAPSGNAKTPVFNAVMKAVEPIQLEADEWYDEAMKKYRKDRLRYEKELRRWKKNSGDDDIEMPEEPDKPSRKRILLDDASIYSVIEAIAENPYGCMVCQDELADFFESLDNSENGKARCSRFLSMYSGRPSRYLRKGQELIASTPALAISGSIQPKILQGIVKSNPQLVYSGLMARFLFTMNPGKAIFWSKASVSKEVTDTFCNLARRIYDMRFFGIRPDRPFEIVLSSEAEEVWSQFFNQNAIMVGRTTDDMIRAGLAKLPTQVARITLTLHVLKYVESGSSYSDWPHEVDAQTMINAIRLIEWYENEFRKVVGLIQGRDIAIDEDMDRILKAIEKSEGDLTVRELQRKTGRRYSGPGGAEELERKLREMIKMNLLSVRTETASNGRAAEHFGFPDSDDADVMDENTGENDDSVNPASPEENTSPVDTMPENAGKNSVNVDLSTRRRPIVIENSPRREKDDEELIIDMFVVGLTEFELAGFLCFATGNPQPKGYYLPEWIHDLSLEKQSYLFKKVVLRWKEKREYCTQSTDSNSRGSTVPNTVPAP